MLFLAVLCLVLYMGGGLLMTLPYWYETANTPSRDVPRLRYTMRNVARLWLESCVAGIFLVAAIIAHPVLARLRAGDKAGEEATGPPLVLVHGLYHNASAWVYLRPHLRRAGFGRIHAFTYSSRHATIPGIVRRLEELVSEMERRYGGEKPVLVGHSLGGLVIRAFMAEGGNAERIAGALTLGAPHKGSKVAALAAGGLGRTLVPGNPFFGELARKEKPARVPCLALVSEADTMVLPQDNLVPPTPGWTLRLTPFTTHTGLLFRPAVLRMTAWELFRMADESPAPVEEPAAASPAPAAPASGNRTPEKPRAARARTAVKAAREQETLAPAARPTSPEAPEQGDSGRKAAAQSRRKPAAKRPENEKTGKRPGNGRKKQ